VAAEPRERVAETIDEDVQLWAAGEQGKGEYRCSECAYEVTVYRTLPVCPICSGSSWEQTAWSPFARALRLQ
jgi:rubrerythrin